MSPIIDKIGLIHSTTKTNGLGVLKNVIKTCKDMLKDRGCTVVEESENIMHSIDNLKQLFALRAMGLANRQLQD